MMKRAIDTVGDWRCNDGTCIQFWKDDSGHYWYGISGFNERGFYENPDEGPFSTRIKARTAAAQEPEWKEEA